MKNEPVDSLTARMRKVLGAWLARSEWEPQQLLDWLQGYGLPPVGHDEEPYVWLLRGLPPADEKYNSETALARRVATILEDKPDLKRPGRRPDQVLYNLLMLCAGLSCPDELAQPLQSILRRETLEGEWLGVNLRYALQSALILNQIDARLLPEWEGLLNGSEHGTLPGGVREGFEGVRLMPPSFAERGSPALDAIGRVLAVMAAHYERDKGRRRAFAFLVNRVIETYPGRPTWDLDLMLQADKDDWPVWAVECLPSLYIPSKETRGEGQIAFLWHYTLSCIPRHFNYKVSRRLCRKQVAEVRLSPEAVAFVGPVSAMMERNRLDNPYPSSRATIGVVIASIIEAQIDVTDAPIGAILDRAVGRASGRAQLLDIIEPIVAKFPNGGDREADLLELASRDAHWAVAAIQEILNSI
jgi:hypothetical protein